MVDPLADQDDFTEYFLRELDVLHQEMRDYAQGHQGIARHLGLETPTHADPHVARFLESFAYLTARVQRKLDDELPELSDALLEVLYPHLNRPIPSMVIAEVHLDLTQSLPSSGVALPRGTLFRTQPASGREPMVYQSTYDTTLWPLSITEAAVDRRTGTALRLRIAATGEMDLGKLDLRCLRIHLKGKLRTVNALYELLAAPTRPDLESAADFSAGGEEGDDERHRGIGLRGITIRGSGGRVAFELPAPALRPVGFDEAEAVLPFAPRSFSGFRLLQEYFAFPQKFHFLELSGLECLKGCNAREVEILFHLARAPRVTDADISSGNFSLTAVPLINLFELAADPIAVNPFVTEHDVVPDAHRPLDLEVFAIESVESLDATVGRRTAYAPFFSVTHETRLEQGRTYWHALRRASRRPQDRGTDVALTFVDLDFRRQRIADPTLHVRLLCSNRDQPAQITHPPEDFTISGIKGWKSVRCLDRPTSPIRPRLRGANHWKLVSQLALSHLSLVQDGGSPLREVLRIYDFAQTGENQDQIEGIHDVRAEPTVRWVGRPRGSGFCRGTRVELVLDRERYQGSSAFLFASVLRHFLASCCAINSFIELALRVRQDKGKVYTWSPQGGEQLLL